MSHGMHRRRGGGRIADPANDRPTFTMTPDPATTCAWCGYYAPDLANNPITRAHLAVHDATTDQVIGPRP